MGCWSARAAGALLVIGAGVMAASAQSGSQPGVYPGRPPGVPRSDQVYEIQAPWGGSSTARRLGVTLVELTPEKAKERKLPVDTGVQVQAVQPGGPAEKAGVRAGDVILEINGEAARSIAQVRRLVNETAVAQSALVTLLRDGKRLDVSVMPEAASPGQDLLPDLQRRLQELQQQLPRFDPTPRDQPRRYYFWSDPPAGERTPQQEPFMVPRQPGLQQRWPLFEWSPGAGRLGVVVQELGPQLAEYFKVKGGVLVTSVTPESPAARAGVKAGDVISAVDGATVKAPDDLARAIRDLPDGRDVTLSVVRASQPMTIKVKLAPDRAVWHV